jgi:hypothetical protein
MNWVQLLTNILGHGLAGFGAGYAATGTWQGGVAAALAAIASNLTGLFQEQPHKQ